MISPQTHTEAAERQFLAEYPAYLQTRHLDLARAVDYARLDEDGQVYLDFTGAALYAESHVRAHLAFLSHQVLGNPHSSNPASHRSSVGIEETRKAILSFFRADTEEYAVVFTANATGALKLVGESYPFEAGSHLLLAFDNHNSMNGIREFARAKGARTSYAPITFPELRLDADALNAMLARTASGPARLFGLPAQSNFSGVLHPLEWIRRAQDFGWDVLLDAAAFAPSHRLDLGRWRPEFAAISFYKMFGYPTGVGCLLVRRDALARLRRPWFAGGTVTVASVQGDRHYFAPDEQAFEDGTLNFLDIPAVLPGLAHLDALGLESIGVRGLALTGWLLEKLQRLCHRNGQPAIQIYGPLNTQRRGAVLTFNLLDPEGRLVDHWEVQRKADAHRISLRTGCFCNPGAGEMALNLTREELEGCFSAPGHEDHFIREDFLQCVDGKGSGAVRVSFGPASNFEDACRFLAFVQDLFTP